MNIISHVARWSGNGITAAVLAVLAIVVIGATRTWLAMRILPYGNGRKSSA
jgi:hypothetical protein